jgi:hypothetical protein
MRRFWQQICGPLNSIWEQPYQFAVWWTVANVFGIAGFVLPIFLSWTRSKNAYDAYLASLKGGGLASFCVVLLAEGIAAALVAQGAGTNLVAAGLRGLASVLALVVAFVQMAFLVAESVITDGSVISPVPQIITAVLAVLLASYLYCFRFTSWEKGVEEVWKADDKAVEDITASAKSVVSDKHGVQL